MKTSLHAGGVGGMWSRLLVVTGMMLMAAGAARTAEATTINVNASGAPQVGRCNLTDALQAASTNMAVHSCPAGSPTATDTIVLAANTTYQNYGKALLIPSTGGSLLIRGPAGNFSSSIIVAPNYGYPSPNPINQDVCPYPAAVFTGGTVTLRDLTLRANQDGTTGICQYAGSLTLDHVIVGDSVCPPSFGFNRGGVWSWPNTTMLHRTLTVTNRTLITGNYTFQHGGGIAAFGNVDVTISSGTSGRTLIACNTTESSGGGVAFVTDGSAKMGNLTVTSADFFNNWSYSWGGAFYLDGLDANSTVTLNDADIQQSQASFTGGGVFVGNSLGLDKVILSGSFFANTNSSLQDGQQDELNSDANTYNAVSCRSSTNVWLMHGSEWAGHNPPFKGDGTCVFP